MGERIPDPTNSTSPDNLGAWVGQVETNWLVIPEYEVDPGRLSHMVLICDGNRRSAREKGLKPWEGHRLGVEVIKGVMDASRQWGIRHLTFWTWSTENWKRRATQVNFVMGLAARYLNDEEAISRLFDHEVRFTHFGRKDRIPPDVHSAIVDLEKQTEGFDRYRVNLALDYGGLDELARATSELTHDIIAGNTGQERIMENPELIFSYLDTAGQPNPDLIVRTGVKPGEVPHTSGFMPIQTAYSGWMFLPDLFPDLHPGVLCDSIRQFEEYERRYGG